jgi:hypothetical protein
MKPAIILMACGAGLALTVALTSCSTDTQVVTPEQKVEVAGKGTIQVSAAKAGRITQKHYKGEFCKPPKWNCYETIVVEAERPRLIEQIEHLDQAIIQGTTANYFATPANYSEIWTSMSPQILADVQSGRAHLKRVANFPASQRQYYLVDSLGEDLDYSGVD